MIQADLEVAEPKRCQNFAYGSELLDFNHRRRRADRIDVALVELAKPSAGGPVRPPDRLNLIALEELRQLVLVLRNHACERHGEIVPKREIRLPACLVLPAFEDLENELVALFAVLAEERFDVLE